jgi:hypothetical protein
MAVSVEAASKRLVSVSARVKSTAPCAAQGGASDHRCAPRLFTGGPCPDKMPPPRSQHLWCSGDRAASTSHSLLICLYRKRTKARAEKKPTVPHIRKKA